jgi:hypothetical protein
MRLAAAILALVAAACGSTAVSTGPGRPRLRFENAGHDFGRQERRRTLVTTVRFRNVGDAPLEIRSIDTNCGCAAALLSRRRIPPGGEGTMRITWQTGSVAGRRKKIMEVVTNDPVQPVVRYPMEIEVVGDARLDPTLLAVRGAGEGVTAHFYVLALDAGKDLRVLDVKTSHPGIRGTAVPLPDDDPRTGYRVDLTFGEALGTGDFHERVTVLTNSPRDPRLTIDVIGSVRREVVVVPERLFFPRTDRAVTRKVFLFRPDGKPLDIKGVDDATGLFDTETRRVDDAKWEIDVELSGEHPPGVVRSSLVVRTDAPGDPRVTVPVEIAGAER